MTKTTFKKPLEADLSARQRDPRNVIVFRINRLATSFSRASAKIYKDMFGLGLPNVRVIYTLADHGELTSKQLVQITAMDKALVSRVLSDLSAQELVAIDTDGPQVRRRPWRLSAKGAELAAAMEPVRTRRQARLMEEFSNAEALHLNHLLDRLFRSSERLGLEEERARAASPGNRPSRPPA
ncbi:MarR family winged helix-turn-helix transcriptional regulator [Roseiarcaceae bacterium H3SJ34-1]|uniref:MarR family winged helix-turn-helix transcriptional regulator n=1 Tax=Terripilifer ovatus TaxID=3032367 RepID=UPI003AB93FFC|nr:MarR family winged helix-turn-helix transcriptional regulator [Roseiarcaceae bacterium H3SJ34-1]